MRIHVVKIASQEQQAAAYEIRKEVFVDEQKVPIDEEIDQFEVVSFHFLAITPDDKPCGAARWRVTTEGVKLERFAVLKEFRSQGVGSALVKKVLEDIAEDPGLKEKKHYLHAQIDAVPLYQKFGFRKEGDMFEECDIQHYKMVKAT